ncbi:YoaK family protein [Aspergillus saccharolyticus JOP 1030-1]|uniref:DUF1275 domain protein n=1 Tax=Aspergillus saccharolyticus JOP 1030-1 TaxID=1450539 RepID=A0A318ZQJ7_9EURO|nr:hypothetical protein BP01DRAFT_370515 [Aspergillus saccharolyticus JOP 1030-1]PYH49889.1 hypothetical protein BP01DRAFT_370515 [Aspergillus saccharolyticus JOP 1030-1]
MPYHQFPSHERDPLLGVRNGHNPNNPTPTPRTHLANLHNYFTQPLARRWTDLLLLTCYIITGLLDSSAVFIWGSFVSMQTGNTVYAGLGLTGLDTTTRWQKSLISIGSFCTGSFLFALLHRRLFAAPRCRGALALSFALQTGCIAVAAVITSVYHPHKDDDNGRLRWTTVVPLALVALQSSGQAVASRVLQFSALTSVVLTSVYCDLFSGPLLSTSSSEQPAAAVRNPDEWRRVGAVVGLLIGVAVGGGWARSEVGLEGALWTAVVLKAGITGAWLCWREEEKAGAGEE